MEGDGQTGQQPKRQKLFTKSEILEKLEKNESTVKDVATEIAKDMCPFDVNDDEAMQIEERIERLEKATKNLSTKIYRIQKDFKQERLQEISGNIKITGKDEIIYMHF